MIRFIYLNIFSSLFCASRLTVISNFIMHRLAIIIFHWVMGNDDYFRNVRIIPFNEEECSSLRSELEC